MFRSDQPIQSHKEDILGRHLFAGSLASAILSYDQKDSFSIGLFGAWGSGKTSIVNMALEEIQDICLTKPTLKAPIIIRFNPWYFSDQNQLIAQFFSELSTALKRQDIGKKNTKLGQTIQAYAGFFEPIKYVPGLSSVGEAIKDIKALGAAAEKAGQAQSKDLVSVKAELNKLLDKLDRRFLIVIDDIDRLNSSEIRQIFQLVKSLADFPHTVYLLSFDKEVVINALKKVQEGSGIEYLEKVVQVPFEIPQISESEVARLLFSQLDEIIKDVPEEMWDDVYWGNIYHSGLRHLFDTIRDVNRYINALRFGFAMVRNEVNPVDFIAITAIQVFLPDLYYGIRENKDLFTGISSSIHSESEKLKIRKKEVLEQILKKVTEPPREILMDFLERLFPRLQDIGYSYDFMEIWRKKGNVCSPDMFDVYFKLSLPKDELSQNEIKKVLAVGHDSELFAKELFRLSKEGKVLRFLERLEDYTHKDIPEESIEPIIIALMDVGDLFPEGKKGFAEINTPMRILRIFYQLSHRYEQKNKRFEIFKKAISQAKRSLYTIVDEVAVQGQQHGKYKSNNVASPEEERTLEPEHLEELERLASNKIEEWASNYPDKLSKHPNLISILFMWDHWGKKEDISAFLDQMIRSDSGLADFIAGFVGEIRSQGLSDYVGKVKYRIKLESIEHFIDIKSLEGRIRKLYGSGEFDRMEEKHKTAIRVFLDTYDGKIDDRY